MSTHEEEEPAGRVRRKTALPAQYEDYDLTGFVLPKLCSEPLSPHTQIPSHLSEDKDQQEGATGFSLLQLKEPHSQDEWSDTEQSRSETDELKQRHESLRYAHKNMLHTVQVVQQERDALQQTNRQYAQELSELKRQMQQLQIQMNQQRPVVQPSSSAIPVHQPRPYQPVPAPRHGKNMQPVKKDFRPVTAPRFRHSLEPFPNAPMDKDSPLFYTPEEVHKDESYSNGQNYFSPHQPLPTSSQLYTALWHH